MGILALAVPIIIFIWAVATLSHGACLDDASITRRGYTIRDLIFHVSSIMFLPASLFASCLTFRSPYLTTSDIFNLGVCRIGSHLRNFKEKSGK